MKKGKVWSNPQLPCLASAVLWVDCGAFLLCSGANYGWSTRANKPSLAFYKPDQIIIVKKSWKKDWLGFYHGVKKILLRWIATADLALANRKVQVVGCLSKKNAGEDSEPPPKSEQGFMLVALCVSLPLLLVLISIFILISFWLKNFWATQKICEDLVLNAQIEMADLVPALLKLNPEILRLKTQRQAIKIKLLAAIAHGNALAITALTAQLKTVEARLLALFVQQNLILQKARLARFKALSQFKNQTQAYELLQSQALYHYSLPLGLVPDQWIDQPAIYKIPDDFLEKQRLELRWTQNLLQNGLAALLRILSLKKSFMRRSCAASLEEKNRSGAKKWQARLIKGKALSNSSY